MANQKEIRTRIVSVKNTQKITRAMKMVAGARLNRAQTRIQEMRPYAQETARVLSAVVGSGAVEESSSDAELPVHAEASPSDDHNHPLLVAREPKRIALLVVTSDKGLCGAFNSSLLRKAEAYARKAEAEGKEVSFYVIGRKGRDFLTRRGANIKHYFTGVWEDLGLAEARRIGRELLAPYVAGEIDAIVLLYNEFVSAMTQVAHEHQLFPLIASQIEEEAVSSKAEPYLFEPSKGSLLEVLVPMYIEVTLLRVLYESMASELGARMTAMDSATKNASDMIDSLTLQYNRARQAAITTELMEIIGGAEALNA